MNPSAHIKSFAEFWPYYVREHAAPGCRALHFIGSTLGLGCLVATCITGKLWLLLLGLALGYGFAWVGHFFVAHNKPASFQYPLWSFRADWKMWALTLTGRMQPEVERALRTI